MLKLFLLGLFFCSANLSAAPLSLKEAAAFALKNSPTFDSSQRQVIISELERKNATSAFLPSLDFSSSQGLQKSYPNSSGSGPWASNFAFTLSENLYDNGNSINKLRASRVQEELSHLLLLKERDRLLLELANSFYNFGLARKNLEIQQEQHAVLKQQVALVHEAYKQGLKTRKDYLRFQTQLNRADIDLVNSKDNVLKAEIDLKRILGHSAASHEELTFTVDERNPNFPKNLNVRLEEHREFKIAELQRKSQDLALDQVQRQVWPEIALNAGATYGSANYLGTGKTISQNDSTSWNALVTLKYNFLDWGTRRRNVEIASQQAAVQGNALSSQLLSLQTEIEKLFLDYRQLQENFALSDDLLKLEKNNLALISSEYRQGKVQYLDYITSLQNFSSAKSSYYSALFALKRGILAQKYHEGQIYEAIQEN